MNHTIKDIVHIESLRHDKQQKIDHSVKETFADLFYFVERNANIREKVRAKHIFCEQTGLSLVELEDLKTKEIFSFWFCFDYVNIQGFTMYQLYLKQNSRTISESSLRVSAFLLALTIEPLLVENISSDKKCIVGKNVFTKEVQQISSFELPYNNTNIGDIIIGWTVKLGYEKKIISPFTVINSQKALLYSKRINKRYQEELNRKELPSWRSFMKLFGFIYLFPKNIITYT
ncbi:hypothetical protein CIB95_13300 [Lottiidibacillus patelloidae]|uniref:Uncharacterized protein n=1 Tax=Lottiidibacillus patelloidae TaxID=2670334 RepID=A0A263BQW0_9BACI|nr:hypothetical protein [Lottiidibacillus patelloidae]OZM56080.1 hypothetical protein CIB95_13300 [Lottiidibacillus patelloidae]